ncbi:histone-like nucleoid-structuring protein Lsr2 [Streptomyces parvulus]|uniref:WhiB family transcriptional regulator n=1 Tax=Streptomyces parvulus TaxID=146923 RepID=UPI0036FC38C1
MNTATTTERWHKRAACAGQDSSAWFRMGAPARTTLDTCRGCPVRAECLYDALTHETPSGVWGGLTPAERRRIPALPDRPRAEVLGLLRTILDRLDNAAPSDERTEPVAQPIPAPSSTDAVAKLVPGPPAELPVDELLAWGDQHIDPEVQAQAARARASLTGLRNRHASDHELNKITDEEEELARRLTELRARKAELLPEKPKGKRQPVDYPAAEVRAWATANGHEVSPTGRVRKEVVEAWRAATAGTS